MPAMPTSLLPPNATPLERALEAATARIGDVPVDVAAIWDPATCPIAVLPWLAWSLSVDSWDPAWPDAVKRDAVARSIALHRRKGTRFSVEAVLARYDELLTLVEWHEATPPGTPHSFDIVLPITPGGNAPGGERATAAFAENVLRDVARVKPLREHPTLIQHLAAQGGLAAQVVARFTGFVRQDHALTVDNAPAWDEWLQTEHGEPIQSEAGDLLDATR